MAKYIAHSSIDERGKISGGQAGDQTGKEVCIRTWYEFATQVLRIEDQKVREAFGNNMIDCANNDNIGYDQGGRNSLLKEAIKVNFDFSKIATKCEGDCSSTVTACVLGAIYKVLGKEAYEKAYAILAVSGNCATTSTLSARLRNLPMVKVSLYTSTSYTKSTSNAVFGDIYNKPSNHVVAYINDGKKVVAKTTTTTTATSTATKSVKATESAKSLSSSIAGTYKATANLNVRNGAGTNKKVLCTIPKNTQVKCYGYYTTVSNTKWYYIQFALNGVTYTGFASSKYLKRV